ncbi:hypothetical protein PMIN04_011113 [Paraphaeosphaeria minitans]|uniref:Extracellular serine-rich protein n=1 Tax=Paraphaeosphaeria minitans TaxID=565426 RepID=A0A9P6GN20_9PLEO|nr:extracellular serine-rich protein [Paraphaeosphaeria minitans]
MHINRALLAAAVATVANSEVHTVDVGEGGLKFEPQTLNPKKGDTVIFHLYPRHNVVSGSFDKPCEFNDDSWFSGPFDQTDNGKKKYVVNVTSEEPVWYYCAVQRHCQNGMVGAWNAPSSGNTINAYANAAQNVGQASTPQSIKGGELFEDEQIASLTGSSPSATQSEGFNSTGATTTASGSQAPSRSSNASATESGALASNTGAADSLHAGSVTGIFGVVIGIAAWFL